LNKNGGKNMTSSKLFKFKPAKELWVVLFTWVLLVFTFYLSFNVITTKRVAAQFITFGIIGVTLLGILVPIVYNTLVMKRPLSGIGIKKDKLLISLVLCVIFTALQYYLTLRTIRMPGLYELTPIITMSLAVGLYENIFYRGWVQLRMEESFGIIPGILLSAVIYSLYHIGYGMPTNEIATLFIIGIVYSSIFRLTSNIFILFPFLTPAGALFTQIKDGLQIPFEATYGFLDVIFLSIGCILIVSKLYKKISKTQLHKAHF
jgi:membrane protease YdiL (CAAX protease family)